MKHWRHSCLLILAGSLLVLPAAAWAEQVGNAVRIGEGSLVYELDARGNRVPDFSSAGYGGGGVAIPRVEPVVRVVPGEGDDTYRLQAAIDYASRLDAGEDGIRGAVLLEAGEFHVSGSLHIRASGVVLRGSGPGEGGTRIIATGTGRRTLIRVAGVNDIELRGEAQAVLDNYVPVGSHVITVEDGTAFSVGDRIEITRPSPGPWIQEVEMHTAPARTHYKWKPDILDIQWERRVAGIEDNTLRLDAPLTTALEKRFGSSTVRRLDRPGRIHNTGIENLRLVSDYDRGNPLDEDHSWMAIEMDDLEDAWVANVTGVHFVSSVVDLGYRTRAVTVMDCASLSPVSEEGGYRRHAFHTAGQQTLFLRCYSEHGRCDYTTGYLAAGPNVFLECRSWKSSDMSGSIGSWSSGILFDNVHIDGGQLALDNLEIRFGGAGWAAANSVLWQSSASQVIVRSPPGAMNWGIGVWGEFYGEGRWQKSNEFVDPLSLYRAQLHERRGGGVLKVLDPLEFDLDGASAPLLEDLGIPTEPGTGKETAAKQPMSIVNGWIVGPGGLMTGGQSPTSWWRGHLIPERTDDHHPSLTRFLPGRYGDGATNDLSNLAREMIERNEIVMRHHWGLWYDRRREDHQMVRRANSDVWPPFYEMPFARSGKGTAWDGLSRYDLTRYNPWYFGRLEQFAEVAADAGRVLVNEMYFQHNIIESGAHWVDFPWRPVNSIQETPFPEPPPFTGDTVMIGNLFYDIEQPVLRETHRGYIRKSLESLAGQANVIHTTGDEYTGPLHFVEFWLETIGEWVREGNPDPVVALSVPKDVQDAVLANPELSGLVDVVEFKYWFETDKGLFAPEGGMELAPRQHLRRWRGPSARPANIANMVRSYRQKYPAKAVIASELRGLDGWAVLAGGGSLPDLPLTLDPELRSAIPGLEVMDPPDGSDGTWVLGNAGKGQFFVYLIDSGNPRIDLRRIKGEFELIQVNLDTGQLGTAGFTLRGEQVVRLPEPAGPTAAYWITKR